MPRPSSLAQGKSNLVILVLAVVAAGTTGVAATLWVTGNRSVAHETASWSERQPTTPRNSVLSELRGVGGYREINPAAAPLTAPKASASGGEAVNPIVQVRNLASATDSRVTRESAATGVVVNERELNANQLAAVRRMYGTAPPRGRYWYDSRSGLYGYWGFEAAGYIRPGHDFGPLSPHASGGATGVFLNGREINLTEALFFRNVFGVVYRGHFWLDGRTGYLGVDGNPIPIANLVVAMQAAQRRNQSEYHWRDGSGSVVSSSGNCTFAAIPGAPVYSTPGCG